MDTMWNACGVGGPAIAAMAAGMGLTILLWLALIVLAVLGIVWGVRSLHSTPEQPGGATPAQARS